MQCWQPALRIKCDSNKKITGTFVSVIFFDQYIVTDTGNMTPAAANLILSNPKINNRGFLESAVRVFKAGVRNDMKVAETLDYDVISPDEARALFGEGQKAAEAQVTARDAEVKAKQKTATEDGSAAERKGGVFYEYDGKTIKQRNDGKHKALTKKQRVAVNFTERLAKKFGSTVFFYESYEENGKRMYKDRDGNIREAKEGFYDPSDGSIHVDLNSDNILFTVSHELVHFIRDRSPVQFKKMADLVMKGFNRQGLTAEELIAAKQKDYAKDGITLTEEQAFEEVIAASLEGIMADGRVMELLQAAEAKDKRLGAKLRQFFQDVKNLIRDTISSYKDAVPGSPEGRLIRKLEDIYSQLQEAFAEGVMDAGTNFQNAENTTGEGGVRYMTPTKPESTFKTGQNVKGEFLTSVLIDLASEEWWTGGYNYAILSMDRNDTTEFEQFYRKIEKRTRNMEEYGTDNGQIVEDTFTVQDGKGKEYIYVVKLDGYLHGVVIAKIDKAKYISYVKKYGRSNNNGRTSANTIRRVSGARAKLGSKSSGGSRSRSSNGYSGSSGVVGSSPQGYMAGNNASKGSGNRKVSNATDSDGNQLRAAQQAYFAESKERDTNGNLQVMYRGDSEEVTVYDRKKSKPSNLHGRGFYYTKEKSHAGQYGIVRAFYLNTVNPLMPDQHNITKEQMLRFLEAIENDGEDYDLYNYGEGATAQSVLETVWGKGDFEMLQDVSASAIGDLVAAVELFNEINGTTYDSIRLPTETVIFNSNQAKLTTNKNPTDDPDIRYSIGSKTDGAVQKLLERENDALREDVARLKELLKLQGTETHGTRFTPSSVEAAARYLKKNAGAKGDTKALARLLNGFYEYIDIA